MSLQPKFNEVVTLQSSGELPSDAEIIDALLLNVDDRGLLRIGQTMDLTVSIHAHFAGLTPEQALQLIKKAQGMSITEDLNAMREVNEYDIEAEMDLEAERLARKELLQVKQFVDELRTNLGGCAGNYDDDEDELSEASMKTQALDVE